MLLQSREILNLAARLLEQKLRVAGVRPIHGSRDDSEVFRVSTEDIGPMSFTMDAATFAETQLERPISALAARIVEHCRASKSEMALLAPVRTLPPRDNYEWVETADETQGCVPLCSIRGYQIDTNLFLTTFEIAVNAANTVDG